MISAALSVTLNQKYEKEYYFISLVDLIITTHETIERKETKDKDLIPAIGAKTT